MMRMRALWLEDRTLRLREDVARPTPPPGEALVRGYYPYAGIPGHEFVGVVEEAPGAPEWTGRRVVGEINTVCDECATCQAGRTTHCERRTVLGIVNRNGAFATHLSLPVANLHPVPDGVPDDIAVECTGNPEGLEVARRAVRPRGTIVLKSTYHGRTSIDLASIVVDEITLIGSRCGPFAPALALLERGDLDPRPLVDERYDLSETLDAFEHAARPGTLKVLVDC